MNAKIQNIQPDYYTQLFFEKGVLVAAVLNDDYRQWLDIKNKKAGSTLSDANYRLAEGEVIPKIKQYLLDMDGYYDTVQTNDHDAAEQLLSDMDLQGWGIENIQDNATISAVQYQAFRFFAEEEAHG